MKSLERTIDDLDPERLAALTEHLSSFVTPERAARIDRTLSDRTRFLTVVLEDIYQTHNASAVVRSCECFGIQDVHVVESSNPFQVNRSIVQGAAKWITLHRYRGRRATRHCLEQLKDAGYRIVAMGLDPGSAPIESLPIQEPLALCFGSEEPGLTRRAKELADMTAIIPMRGFTQSLNLSVSVAIALRDLGDAIRQSNGNWQLNAHDHARLRALWLARSVVAGGHIVERYLESAPA